MRPPQPINPSLIRSLAPPARARSVADMADNAAPAATEVKQSFEALQNQGFEKYRAQDLQGALDAWEQAYEINPTDKTLETNIRILRKKLGVKA